MNPTIINDIVMKNALSFIGLSERPITSGISVADIRLKHHKYSCGINGVFRAISIIDNDNSILPSILPSLLDMIITAIPDQYILIMDKLRWTHW